MKMDKTSWTYRTPLYLGKRPFKGSVHKIPDILSAKELATHLTGESHPLVFTMMNMGQYQNRRKNVYSFK